MYITAPCQTRHRIYVYIRAHAYIDTWRYSFTTTIAVITTARAILFFLVIFKGKDSPAQFNLRLFSRLDDFLEQNPIVTTKHWHISSVRSTANPAELISRPWQPSSRLKKDDGSCCSLLEISSRYRSHSFSRTSFSSGCSLARPRTPPGRGRGGQTTRVLSPRVSDHDTILYIYIYRFVYIYMYILYINAILVTAGSHAVSRDYPFFPQRMPAIRTKIVHGTATRSARRAHTTPGRVL